MIFNQSVEPHSGLFDYKGAVCRYVPDRVTISSLGNGGGEGYIGLEAEIQQ